MAEQRRPHTCRLRRAEQLARLSDAGVATELHLHPGCEHTFEALARGADVTQRAIGDRIRRLRAF